MRANSGQANLSDDRQREHQRQQERLKAMAASSDKAHMVSADIMIENLLKESFKKVPEVPISVNQSDDPYSELPLWLQCESASVPPQYSYLWSLVQSTVDLADTQKVSQLLLTSGLHIDLLGFIWNIANKTIPGQLTKQEFYIVLALVGLAQTGYTFNNLNVLKLVTAPSIPVLQVIFQNYPVPQPYVSQNSGTATSFKESENTVSLQSQAIVNLNNNEKDKDHFINSAINESPSLSDFKKSLISQKENNGTNLLPNTSHSRNAEFYLTDQAKGLHRNSNFPCIGSSPTAELEDDFSAFQSVSTEKQEDQKQSSSLSTFDSADDFTEFQSASVEHLDPFETIVINQKREIPRIPLPKTFNGKFTNIKSNILKISPETEKKLKVLSPTESLSSLPESKISSSNKVSTSISVLGSNQGIGSRLANHSFSGKLERPKCHKHHKIKINPISPVNSSAADEIILGVKTRNLESVIPKCRPKNSSSTKTFLLKETKIRNSDTIEQSLSEQLGGHLESSILKSGENTRQIEIPMLGTFNETVLPTQSKPQAPSIDLISVQEDKYSALREIEMEINQEKSFDAKEVNDDFGDFLSADIPPPSVKEASAASLFDSNATTVKEGSAASLFDSNAPPKKEASASSLFDSNAPSVKEASAASLFDSNAPTVKEGSAASLFDSNAPSVKEISATSLFDSNPPSVCVNTEEKGDWGDWNFNTETNLHSTDILSLENSQKSNEVVNEGSLPKAENDLFDSFATLTVNENYNQLIQTDLNLPQQQDAFDLMSKGPDENEIMFGGKADESSKGNQSFSTQSDNEFWEFLSNDIKPPSERDFTRCGSLPSLDLKILPTDESEQDFIWRKCLDSCHGLIQEGYEIFNKIATKSVLDEVFAAPKTEEYLNYLNIVFQISKRVSQNLKNLPPTQEELEKLWGRLQDLCFEYNIKLKHDEDTCFEGKSRCSICLRRIGYDIINQGTSSYHPTCANLWINCVEGSLPVSIQ